MRQSYAETQIPAGVADVPYPDHHKIVRGLGRHMTEMYAGEVTGAGGAGGSLLNVPFEPAMVRVVRPHATTSILNLTIFAASATTSVNEKDGTVGTNATKTKVADGNWTVGLPTGIAPDGVTVQVIVHGFADAGGSK